MCGPGAVAPLMIASTVVSTLGTGFAALQANQQAKYQARIAERNAALEREAAETDIENTKREALAVWRNAAQVQGRQRLAAAANGVSADFGTAADVVADTRMLASEDVARIYEDGNNKLRSRGINMANYRSQAQASRQAAKGALYEGIFAVGSTALGGATQYARFKSNLSPGAS